jgi:hypothetical protein
MWLNLGLMWVTCWACAGAIYQLNLQEKKLLDEGLVREWQEIDFR